MNFSAPSLDRSTKCWLTASAVALLVSFTVIAHTLAKALSPVPELPTPVGQTTRVRPIPVSPPVSWPEPTVPSIDHLSETERNSLLQRQIHEQAIYLRQLSKQYPKTASLPSPEQIDQMEKEGRMAQ